MIVRKLAEGGTYGEAATAAGISRQALWKRVNASPGFAQAVVAAREEGKSEREYRAWLRHPFRGLRPPTGKGTRAVPRYTYGRR